MPRARLESDAATRRRSTDANRVRPDATFGLPRRAASAYWPARCRESAWSMPARVPSETRALETWRRNAAGRGIATRRSDDIDAPRCDEGSASACLLRDARVVSLCTVTRHRAFSPAALLRTRRIRVSRLSGASGDWARRAENNYSRHKSVRVGFVGRPPTNDGRAQVVLNRLSRGLVRRATRRGDERPPGPTDGASTSSTSSPAALLGRILGLIDLANPRARSRVFWRSAPIRSSPHLCWSLDANRGPRMLELTPLLSSLSFPDPTGGGRSRGGRRRATRGGGET